MRVLRSRKLRALQQAFKKPWWLVGIEWASKPLTQKQIGDAWTKKVARSTPDVRFAQQDVCRIVGRAIERQAAEDPTSVQHLIEPTAAAETGVAA